MAFRSSYWKVCGLIRFLALAELDFWYKAAWDKQTRDTDRRAIGISSIFDAAFLYLPFFLTVLRYFYPPILPSCRKWSWTAGENGIICQEYKTGCYQIKKNQTCPFSYRYASGSPSLDRGVEGLFFLCWLIYLFILFFRVFKRTRSARHAKV